MDIISSQDIIQSEAGFHVRVLFSEIAKDSFILVANEFENSELMVVADKILTPIARADYSDSFMFRPPILLATLIAPTITYFNVQQLWLLLPNTPRFVTSPCPGYTSRPNRAIDGRGLSPHKTYSLVGCPPNIRLFNRQKPNLFNQL